VTTIRWDLFDTAVNAARMVAHDDDIARDAALAALQELGDGADAGRARRRARDRAKDALRRYQPGVHSVDMDTLAATTNVFEEAAKSQHDDKLLAALGSRAASIIRLTSEGGYTNADIARLFAVSEETARLWRNAAELQRDILGL